MEKNYVLLFVLFCFAPCVNAQVFEVETIQNNGDPNKLINLVIMGDGYTAAEQNLFVSKAQGLTSYLFDQTPWAAYKNYFNVYAIKVVSNQSGAKHANTSSDCNTANPSVPVSSPDNYFGSRFDNYNIHRLIIATNSTRVANVLAANVPNYDLATVIANTSYYGGSGGNYATITANASANEIMAHEMGHSFAGLADEYYAGDMYFGEKPNMTNQTDPTQIKWKNWLNSDEAAIGVFPYCCGGNSSLWRKPASGDCKMEYLGTGYCAVCREAIIEKIHTLVNPILAYSPVDLIVNSMSTLLDFNLSQLIKPIPNTLAIAWQLDGNLLPSNLETFQLDQTNLSAGTHTLTASVTDETEYVRTNNHAMLHVNAVTWTIERSPLGVHLVGSENKIAYAIAPNPTTNTVNIAVELDKNSTVSVELATADGKTIQHVPSKNAAKGNYTETINIERLAKGTYFVILKIDGVSYSKTIVKQ